MAAAGSNSKVKSTTFSNLTDETSSRKRDICEIHGNYSNESQAMAIIFAVIVESVHSDFLDFGKRAAL